MYLRKEMMKKEYKRILDPYKEEIRELVTMGVSINSIKKIINAKHFKKPRTYGTYLSFIREKILS